MTEVQKDKTVSGNLSIGTKTFCENTKVKLKKVTFCPLMDLLNVQKSTHFLKIKVPEYNIILIFFSFLGYSEKHDKKYVHF